jgi:hypothetical protein
MTIAIYAGNFAQDDGQEQATAGPSTRATRSLRMTIAIYAGNTVQDDKQKATHSSR